MRCFYNSSVFVLLAAILLSCHFQQKEAVEYVECEGHKFRTAEFQTLMPLLLFLDSLILGDQVNIGSNYEGYHDYLKHCDSTGMKVLLEALNDPVHKDRLKAILKELKEENIWSEVWNYRTLYNPISQDSVYEYAINLAGKYPGFLCEISRRDSLLREYHSSLIISGEISPGAHLLMLRESDRMDFDKDEIRLIFTVHLLTVASQIDDSLVINLEGI